MKRAKPGDIVHVRGVVTESRTTEYLVEFERTDQTSNVVRIDADDITHIEWTQLAVGDIVFDNGKTSNRYEIIGIHGDDAWTKSQSTGKTYVEKLSDLTRIDDA